MEDGVNWNEVEASKHDKHVSLMCSFCVCVCWYKHFPLLMKCYRFERDRAIYRQETWHYHYLCAVVGSFSVTFQLMQLSSSLFKQGKKIDLWFDFISPSVLTLYSRGAKILSYLNYWRYLIQNPNMVCQVYTDMNPYDVKLIICYYLLSTTSCSTCQTVRVDKH